MKAVSYAITCLGLLFSTSCSTSTLRTVKHHSWIEAIRPASAGPAMKGPIARAPQADPSSEKLSENDRIQQNLIQLESQFEELQHISKTFTALRKDIERSNRAYFTAIQNDQAGLLLLRYQQAQDDLWHLMAHVSTFESQDPVLDAQAALIRKSASAYLSWIRSDIAVCFFDNPSLQKFLDSEFPHYDISKGSYSSLVKSVTEPSHLESLNLATQEIQNQPLSSQLISQLRSSIPEYAYLIDRLPYLYSETSHNARTLLGPYKPDPVATLSNHLWHSKVADTGRRLNQIVNHQLYSAQGNLYKGVARIKNPTKSIIRFSPAQVQQIKSRMKPGDILLSFTEGYVSTFVLPGTFKHCITYIGDYEERQEIGLNDEFLAAQAVNPDQYSRMLTALNTRLIPSGEKANLVEAVVEEGVRIHSLERLLATHINSLVVLRPVIDQDRKKQQIIDLFRYVGTPYDYRFNFSDATRNCCSELIYRTLEPNTSFRFPLTRELGHWVLTADGIANYHLDNPGSFEFVLLAEEGQGSSSFNAAVLMGEEGKTRLRKIMEH